jgi:hypothetical protein
MKTKTKKIIGYAMICLALSPPVILTTAYGIKEMGVSATIGMYGIIILITALIVGGLKLIGEK